MTWIILTSIATAIILVLAARWILQRTSGQSSESSEGDNGSSTNRLVLPTLSGGARALIAMVVAIAVAAATFNQVFFYAEPGYIYHVRTITGEERVVDGVGYSMHLFGRVNAWKKAMTVLADNATANGLNAEGEASTASASLSPINMGFS